MLKLAFGARFALCVFASVGMMALTGCGDTPDTPFPVSSSESGAQGESCGALEFASFDEAIDGGYYSFGYGTIEKVEPVLDLFGWNSQIEEGQTSCDGDADVALRIHVKLSDSTWDAAADEVIVVGVGSYGWMGSVASPYVRKNSQSLRWTDGHDYFRPGDQLGMLGGFSEQGHFLVGSTNFFTVNGEGKIANFRQSRCLTGDLNGMALDDVIARSHTATDGEKLYLSPTPTPPLYSVCTN